MAEVANRRSIGVVEEHPGREHHALAPEFHARLVLAFDHLHQFRKLPIGEQAALARSPQEHGLARGTVASGDRSDEIEPWALARQVDGYRVEADLVVRR